MKDKKKFLGIIGILVPVIIAAWSEWSDQVEAKKQEEEMDELRERVKTLEEKA